MSDKNNQLPLSVLLPYTGVHTVKYGYGYREISQITRVSARTCGRMCKAHGIEWVSKSTVAVTHTTYGKRTAHELIDSNHQKNVNHHS